jgi:peptidylprolyl isomerase
MRFKGRVIGALWAFALGIAACSPPDAALENPGSGLARRAPDGLLERPDLQLLVEAQYAGDAGRLQQALEHPDAAVRARAAYGLASLAEVDAADALARRLDDDAPEVRADAAFALGQLPELGGRESDVLARLERESVVSVRRALVEALGKQGSPAAVSSLLAEVGDETRAEATLALSRAALDGRAPEAAVDTLLRRLVDLDPEVRQRAAWFIGRSPSVLPWVAQRARVRNALARYRVDDPAAMYLLQGLGRYFDIVSLPRILQGAATASDWRLRASAVASLARVGNSDPRLEAVLAGLHDPAPLVRLQAALLLPNEDAIRPFIDDAVEQLRAEPQNLAMAAPVLLYLARSRVNEPLLDWARARSLDDRAGWATLAPALAEFDGPEAPELLARAVEFGTDPVAVLAVGALERRWQLVEPFGFLHEEFEGWRTEVSDAVMRRDTPIPAEASAVLEALRLALENALDDGGAGLDIEAADLAAGGAQGAPEVTPARSPVRLDWNLLQRLGPQPRLVLDTDQGSVVAVLDTEAAPLTVARLAELANAGALDGVAFHRVIPNFVAQTGDLGPAAQDWPAIRTEATRIPFAHGRRGRERVLGMARSDARDTETTQFFITHSMQPHLDGGYTGFGWVVQGHDVVDRLLPWDRIHRARVRPTGRRGHR